MRCYPCLVPLSPRFLSSSVSPSVLSFFLRALLGLPSLCSTMGSVETRRWIHSIEPLQICMRSLSLLVHGGYPRVTIISPFPSSFTIPPYPHPHRFDTQCNLFDLQINTKNSCTKPTPCKLYTSGTTPNVILFSDLSLMIDWFGWLAGWLAG